MLSFCTYRSSRQDVFCKKGVLKKFAKFTGKHRARVSVPEALAQMFSCEFCKISKSTFFTKYLDKVLYKTPPVAGSLHPNIQYKVSTNNHSRIERETHAFTDSFRGFKQCLKGYSQTILKCRTSRYSTVQHLSVIPSKALKGTFKITAEIFSGSSVNTDVEPKGYSTTQYIFIIPPIKL